MGTIIGLLSGSTTPTLGSYIDSSVVTAIGNLVTTVLGWITANPILSLFFTMTMISIAFVVIGWLKGVIRLK